MTRNPTHSLRSLARAVLRRMPGLRGFVPESGAPISVIRAAVSAPWLPPGQGIEIGAGASPQPLPQGCRSTHYDLRTPAELAELFSASPAEFEAVRPIDNAAGDFPRGADFLLAHNVLEHCAEPIGQLMAWHRLVRPAGTFVISLPDMQFCPDRLRRVATLEHLVLDHVLNRNQYSYESLEHVFSFVMGWNDDGAFAGKSKHEVASMAHWCATQAKSNDCHWHAFDATLGQELIEVAALFGGQRAEFKVIATPASESDLRTNGDLIYVYRLVREDPPSPSAVLQAKLQALAAALGSAHERLRTHC